MIVVDTNVLVYLFLKGEHTSEVTRVFERDAEWAAPRLWRSEFRNVLALYVRLGKLSLTDAVEIVQDAEVVMRGREYEPSSEMVMLLAAQSGCSAYDCEFVAVARDLGVPLVSSDREVTSAFPGTAVLPGEFKS